MNLSGEFYFQQQHSHNEITWMSIYQNSYQNIQNTKSMWFILNTNIKLS